ncbi:SPC19 [Candida oxycetoniae]|uniref:DASH complex subunit SPC19 n=1 Tax=Candida oxycetoniae TaxID=497107 RepID=A0AAI9SVM9_9ASCO|nr:SPC19 [Candida oxycetoniae]KAI3403921.2 SPC19 [Candida oxycetoniae]
MSHIQSSPYHPYNNLENCSRSLRESIQLLKDCSNDLEEKTLDSKRMIQVLSTKKVFGLIPEFDLDDAKQSYRSTITPQLDEQVHKLEEELQILVLKRKSLASKLKLTKTRLNNYQRGMQSSDVDLEIFVNNKNYDESSVRKLQMLRNKKKRLQYTLNRVSSSTNNINTRNDSPFLM